MNATAVVPVVAVDVAKAVFQLAVADQTWRVVEQLRLSRTQFERWFVNRAVGLVVMEACGSAHHWARWLSGLGIEVRLLPAAYIRAYVKRNKTDAADARALLEATRCAEITPVKIKSIEQQALQGLHRTRSLWMATRTSRINALRGFCREFGIVIAQGSRLGVEQIGRVLADPRSSVPMLIRGTMTLLIEEIRLLEVRIAQLEGGLTALARQSAACATLLSIPGVGDHRYLRMLLTHGARAVLRAATAALHSGKKIDALRQWALTVQTRSNHNKATCALANKLARICYATLRDHQPYGAARLNNKIARTAFALPA